MLRYCGLCLQGCGLLFEPLRPITAAGSIIAQSPMTGKQRRNERLISTDSVGMFSRPPAPPMPVGHLEDRAQTDYLAG